VNIFFKYARSRLGIDEQHLTGISGSQRKKLPSQLKDDKNSLVNQSLSSEGQDASKSGNMSRRGNEAVLDDSSYGNKDAVATLPIYVQILLHLWHIGKINDTKEPILKSTWCL
jgi:hypothetical protein